MRYLGGILFLACSIASANALECVSFKRPGEYPNIQKIPTANGELLVFWMVANTRLPVRRVRLPDGSYATGAVPGKVPMTFAFADKTGKIRGARGLSFSYVTETADGDRFIEMYDAAHVLIEKKPVPGRPFLKTNSFKYPAEDPRRGIVQSDLTMPGALVSRFCVDPGDRVKETVSELIKRLRSRSR